MSIQHRRSMELSEFERGVWATFKYFFTVDFTRLFGVCEHRRESSLWLLAPSTTRLQTRFRSNIITATAKHPTGAYDTASKKVSFCLTLTSDIHRRPRTTGT